MSIGQGFVLSTPLQVANYTAAIANHGNLFQPQLVERVTDADGKTVRVVEPKLIRKVPVDPAYLDIVREGMYGVVNWPGVGTATSIKLPGVSVAGKTGTAEYFRDLDKDGKEDRDPKGNLPTHAWFTSFAPYENPELVVTVLVVNAGEGSQVAAPIAAKVLRKYFGIPEPAQPTPTATATKQP
jgi:penicillin-binding protein 2